MNETGFLERLAKLRVETRQNERFPNKPLQLLYALGRVARGEERLVEYRDAEGKLRELLNRFGRPNQVQSPELAYTYLCSDGLWEIPKSDLIPRRKKRGGRGAYRVGELRSHGAGGFPVEIDAELRDDPELVHRGIQKILADYFRPSLHDDIRDEIGVPSGSQQDQLSKRRARDPQFRRDVLRAYEYRCAICDFNVRMDDDLLGLEAAHIRAHCEGGPDKVSNGLALCTLHHKALDLGAVGLNPAGARFRVMVSESVHGDSRTAGLILDYHGSPIRRPQATSARPDLEYVEWHTDQVFRKPSRQAA